MRRQRVTLKKRYGLLLTQLLSESPISTLARQRYIY